MNPLKITLILFLLIQVGLLGCIEENYDITAILQGETIYYLDNFHKVVPSEGLPSEVDLQNANNNLDVVMHQGRYYLGFRTAPTHFASPSTRLYIVSSTDQTNWRFEWSYSMNTDLREPRFLSYDGKLFMYFAVLGTNALDFEPKAMMVTEYKGPGDWTTPVNFYMPEEGFIPWRTKVVDGVPYMITYIGGENIYDYGSGEPMEVHWLTTTDGYTWEPVISGQPAVLIGGGSETDFVFMESGALIAVSRNEAGDELGWGMKICRAEPGSLGDWNCVADPKKYDSPILFNYEDRVYLIGRRNLNESGNYYLGRTDLDKAAQTLYYEAQYWQYPKRCSLWEVDPNTLIVSFILDLPSKGDTCFPGIVDRGQGHYEVYNYTSPVDGPDISWVEGQQGHTYIYRQSLFIR